MISRLDNQGPTLERINHGPTLERELDPAGLTPSCFTFGDSNPAIAGKIKNRPKGLFFILASA